MFLRVNTCAMHFCHVVFVGHTFLQTRATLQMFLIVNLDIILQYVKWIHWWKVELLQVFSCYNFVLHIYFFYKMNLLHTRPTNAKRTNYLRDHSQTTFTVWSRVLTHVTIQKIRFFTVSNSNTPNFFFRNKTFLFVVRISWNIFVM